MAMAKKKNNFFTKETTHIIDAEDGEILRSEIVTRKRVTAERFVQLYLDDFGGLMNVKGDAEYKVLLWIAKSMNFETNEIVLTMAIKKRIAVETGLQVTTLGNAITSLYQKQLIVRVDSTIYMLNPKYFFKGKIEDRMILVRTMEYYIQEAGADDVAVVDE